MLTFSDFLKLKRNLKKDFSRFISYRLAVIGDSSTQLLTQAIKGYGYDIKVDFEIYESDYNQIEQEVFTSSSGLYDFNPDFVILFHSRQKLLHKFQLATQRNSFAEDHINDLRELVQSVKNNSKAKIIYFNFIDIPDGVFGNYANQVNGSFAYQIRKLNYELMNFSIEHKNFFINDISSLNNLIGYQNSFDPKLYVNNDLVFSLDFTAAVAKSSCDIITAIIGKFKKCLILDLDNTLWGGIIGDDGLENIQIGDLGIGKAFSGLQHWAKQLKERGVILAICSKNTENLAKEPFEKHPEMVLRLDDISVFVANWDNKADNIRYIQSILNIGFDSMVFLDDNAFERELVKRELPDITVPELPMDPSEYVSYLTSLNLFETISFVKEDTERTKQYQQEAKRAILKKTFTSDSEYLISLGMESQVEAFNKYNIPRIAQLTLRSNQFNLRTVRYTEEEINRISLDDKYETMSFSLNDRYGDHGLIAAVILKHESDYLFIDTWVMSCRVLKRGMEQFILNQIKDLARRKNISYILGEYIPTIKNKIVENLYHDLGFVLNGKFWQLHIDKPSLTKTYINAK